MQIEPFDRWYVLKSADAMATRSWSTEEIVDAYQSGALGERIVVYNRFDSRRQAITVKDLVAGASAKKRK